MLNKAACQDIIWLLQGLSPVYFERIYPGRSERIMNAATLEVAVYMGERVTKEYRRSVVKLINTDTAPWKQVQRQKKLQELYAECKAIAEPYNCDIMDALLSASATNNFQEEA
jgi:hypothetical protein